MATVRLGSIVADIRGSVGQETFGRNPGGIFVRERVSPAQPASAERDLRQAAWTAITQYWSGTLTGAQRTGWHQYAEAHLLPDRWGRLKAFTGFCHFTRCNVQRYRYTTAVMCPDPPTHAPPHMPAFPFWARSYDNLTRWGPTLTNYDPPANTTRVFCYTGFEVNAGRSFYNGPWRYLGYREWTVDHWYPSTPQFTNFQTLTTGKRLWGKLVVVLADGATSVPGFGSCTIVYT